MKALILFAVGIALVGIAWGQPNRYGVSDAEAQEIMAMIKSNHLASGSLAYRSAVAQRMLPEVNYFSARLPLPTPHPIQFSDVTELYVAAPWYSGLDQSIQNTNISSPIERIRTAKITVRGVIQTANFFFSFNNGKLLNVCRMENGENYIAVNKFGKWAAIPSLINNTQAFQLATQWLASIDVDTGALEKKYGSQMKIDQAFFFNPSGTTNKTLLPIFNVTWGQEPNYSAQVRILGITKELMEFNLADVSLSHRPLLTMTNAIELVNIPDPQLKKLQSSFSTNLPSLPP